MVAHLSGRVDGLDDRTVDSGSEFLSGGGPRWGTIEISNRQDTACVGLRVRHVLGRLRGLVTSFRWVVLGVSGVSCLPNRVAANLRGPEWLLARCRPGFAGYSDRCGNELALLVDLTSATTLTVWDRFLGLGSDRLTRTSHFNLSLCFFGLRFIVLVQIG